MLIPELFSILQNNKYINHDNKKQFYFLLLKIENIFELFIQINRMIKNTSLDIKIILKTYLKIG